MFNNSKCGSLKVLTTCVHLNYFPKGHGSSDNTKQADSNNKNEVYMCNAVNTPAFFVKARADEASLEIRRISI